MMILAASGIILKNKKILLLKRSDYTENYPGSWGCPGGRAEAEETAEENVIREVKEECNLDFVPVSIFKSGIWKNRNYFRYLGTWSGEIKIQEQEVSSFGWFTYLEAKNLEFSFDYRDVLEMLKKANHL